MVKFFSFAALVLATVMATACAAPVVEAEGGVAEAVPGFTAAAPASSPLDKRQRQCCKTTVAKCEIFGKSVRNPGQSRVIWQNEQGTKMVAYDFSTNGKWGKDKNWYTECRAGYCYAVNGLKCRFYLQQYPDNYGECNGKGFLYYHTCKPSFCSIYC